MRLLFLFFFDHAVDRPFALLFGPSGQLGRELRPMLEPFGRVVAAGREEVDLQALGDVRRLIQSVRPEVVVNAAAYTDVDGAETDEATAEAVNAKAPHVMAEAARDAGARLVHYSTDYVFDGTAERPYREDDPARPQGVYGRTKRAGETAIQAVGGRYWIVRTSWLFSVHRSNFVKTMLRLAGERDHLTVVDDQFGSPTSAEWLARCTAQMLQRGREGDITLDAGIVHACGAGQTSWYGLARAVFARAGLDVEVDPVTTDAFPRPASRPAYAVLDTRRLRETFAVEPPPWPRQLAQVVDRLVAL